MTSPESENIDENEKKRPRLESQEAKEQEEDPLLSIEGQMPQKKFYRARAHCNPLSNNDTFLYPKHPTLMDWKTHHYPNATTKEDTDSLIRPNILDIGCGFGGLTVALGKILPDDFILGMEIRAKVCEYVRLRIAALRKEQETSYQNCSVLRSNTMKYMPNLFEKSSIDKMFFCFPDPHFKKKNHPRRIISERLLTEYAYFLKPTQGKLYCITDVEELHNWHVEKLDAHPLFEKCDETENDADPCVQAMINETEEGKKVSRAGAAKYYAVYRRIVLDDSNLTNEKTSDCFWNDDTFGVINARISDS